jgi:ribosomal protein S5
MGTRVATPWVDPRAYRAEDAAAEAADEQDDERFGLPDHPRGYRRADSRGRAPQLIGRDQIAKMPIQSTISINRIAVVRKGGKVLKFAAIVVCGNGKGLAAIGKGKDKEVGRAVEKAVARAHRMQAMHYFQLYDDRTVFHDTSAKFKQTKLLLMAAREGTGLNCNNSLSLICEAIGIKDLQAKVCMYVCMCVCLCMYVCMHGCVYACVCACMLVCMCVCMYVCMYMYICICVHVYVYVYVYVYAHTTHTHAHTHARTHAHTHTHTHTHRCTARRMRTTWWPPSGKPSSLCAPRSRSRAFAAKLS